MNLHYEWRSSISGPLIGMELHHIGPTEDMRHILVRQVIDTGDATVRAALIKLGWTPPTQGFAPA